MIAGYQARAPPKNPPLEDSRNFHSRKTRMSKVTFESLRAANASRAPRWHTSPAGMNEWTIGDWFMAMAGEVGEGADDPLPLMFMSFVGKLGALGNMAKKYRRVQEGIANKANDPSRHINAENAIAKMFEELADVQI